MGIENYLNSNDKKALENNINFFEMVMNDYQVDQTYDRFLEKLKNQMEQDNSLALMKGMTDFVYESNRDPLISLHLTLGSWIEGLKLGMQTNPINIPMPEAVDYFIDNFKKQ